MTQSVLGSITLGYRPLWNRYRALAGYQLFVDGQHTATPIDAAHLLRTQQEMWPENGPSVLLSVQSPQLLCDLLAHAPASAPRIEVRHEWLDDPTVRHHVGAAHGRGLRLVWRGELSHLPDPEIASSFTQSLLTLGPGEAAAALHGTLTLPPGQLYEHVASRALADRCLDDAQAWAIAGWPSEDVLHGLRGRMPEPTREVLTELIRAINADQSMEQIEHILHREPVLSYRFLMHLNSASYGLRNGVESLRHGLMMLGYTSLGKWIAGQLPNAATDADLVPAKTAVVLRARLMEHLMDAGVEDGLRREIYLCGLFSELGDLMGEPLGTLLNRLPLSNRIYEATVTQTGAYWPTLEMARALESDDLAAVREVCARHELDTEEVNRALLRSLADLPVQNSSY